MGKIKQIHTLCEGQMQGDYFRGRREAKLLLSCVMELCVILTIP